MPKQWRNELVNERKGISRGFEVFMEIGGGKL
jgi:hypothetical protein